MTILVRAIALISLASPSACHRAHAGGQVAAREIGVPASADSVRGVVRVVGSTPMSQVIISSAGKPSVAVTGSLLGVLKDLSGVEVVAAGRLTGDMLPASPRGAQVLDVARFEVVAVDGVAALDGIVELDKSGAWLRLSDNRRLSVKNLPPALRVLPGARVFLVGPIDQAPASYGIISRAP